MQRRASLVVLAVGALTACARRPYREPTTAELLSLKPLIEEPAVIQEPPPGVRTSAAVGAPMVVANKARWWELVHVEGVQPVKWAEDADFTSVLLPPTGWFHTSFISNAKELYLEEIAVDVQRSYKGKPYDSYKRLSMYRIDSSGRVSLVMRDEGDTQIKTEQMGGAQIRRKTERDPAYQVRFRRELVYTGRSGQTISILYREYSDDMARPAFSQQLQYDIDKDPVIGYQGARFKVLSATNTEVSFEVLEQLR